MTRAALDYAAKSPGADEEVMPWDDMMPSQPGYYDGVQFQVPEASVNPFYRRGPAPVVHDHASNGTLWQPSRSGGAQALYDHVRNRLPGR